jgi:hypothetical protein
VVEFCLVKIECSAIEAREDDSLELRMLIHALPRYTHRDRNGFRQRIAINAATDRGESDGSEFVLECELEAFPITRGQ